MGVTKPSHAAIAIYASEMNAIALHVLTIRTRLYHVLTIRTRLYRLYRLQQQRRPPWLSLLRQVLQLPGTHPVELTCVSTRTQLPPLIAAWMYVAVQQQEHCRCQTPTRSS